jgi:hypothetical protein
MREWHAPAPEDVGETAEAFLRRLGEPTWLLLPGQDRSRARAVTTLLHGNEPSGTQAIHRFLRSGQRPAVDLHCCIASVAAALEPPLFSARMLPGARDLNRCFRPPFADGEGRLAEEILTRLRELRPECLIDLHNTSGTGPAYAVAPGIDQACQHLTALFSGHYILTDLRMGTLNEATLHDFPTVTIECGGANDSAAHQIAFAGLLRYATEPEILAGADAPEPLVMKHPIRVQLRDGASIAYGEQPIAGADVTLRTDVDRHNFGVLAPGEVIGWFGPRGIDVIAARDGQGRERSPEVFLCRGDCFEVSRPARLFMVTTRPDIAKSDCLFYILPVNDL